MKPSALTSAAPTYEIEVFGRIICFQELYLGMTSYLCGQAECETYYIFLHSTVELAIHFDKKNPNPRYLSSVLRNIDRGVSIDILKQLRQHFPYRWMEQLRIECYGLTEEPKLCPTQIQLLPPYLPYFS